MRNVVNVNVDGSRKKFRLTTRGFGQVCKILSALGFEPHFAVRVDIDGHMVSLNLVASQRPFQKPWTFGYADGGRSVVLSGWNPLGETGKKRKLSIQQHPLAKATRSLLDEVFTNGGYFEVENSVSFCAIPYSFRCSYGGTD